MFIRVRVLLVAAACLLSAGAWVSAQILSNTPVNPPKIMAGPDVGFRITSIEGDTPIGSLVVRIDGKWVEVREGRGPERVMSR